MHRTSGEVDFASGFSSSYLLFSLPLAKSDWKVSCISQSATLLSSSPCTIELKCAYRHLRRH